MAHHSINPQPLHLVASHTHPGRTKKKNQLLPDADIFVAAVTLEKAEALVTGNTRHFERIDGLALENWAT
jgi:predicted nucleic acid-binding protein